MDGHDRSRWRHGLGEALSERHQRIDRRSGTAFHRQRRERNHELVPVQPPRGCGKFLEIEALDDIDPYPDQRRHMDHLVERRLVALCQSFGGPGSGSSENETMI